MSTREMIDSAYPLHPEPHKPITLVYIGGDTPHAWTAAEIRALPSRWVLPTWVRSDPQDVNPAGDADACIARLRDLGVPKGTTVCLDLEVAINAGYVDTFNRLLTEAGYRVLKYGSGSRNGTGFIWNNPKTSGGTFIAAPDHDPNIPNVGDCVAVQYDFAGSYDLSTVKDQATVPLFEINPPGGQPPPASWMEKIMNDLPTIQNGDTGDHVRTVQGLLRARHHEVMIDGRFGHLTENAVTGFQRKMGLTVDGIVGQHTWGSLIAASKQ